MKVRATKPVYIKEIGRKLRAGDEVDLPDEVVDEYARAYPGALQSGRQTMEKSPEATMDKSEPEPESKPKAKPKPKAKEEDEVQHNALRGGEKRKKR